MIDEQMAELAARLRAEADSIRNATATIHDIKHATDLERAADLIEQMASAEPVAWIKYLEGAAVKPTGECYDMVFVPVHGYEPLFRAPQPAPIPGDTALMQRALDALTESESTVEHEYVCDWRHGIPTREKQLAAMKASLDEHLAVIEALRERLATAPQPPDHSEQPLDMVANGIRSDR